MNNYIYKSELLTYKNVVTDTNHFEHFRLYGNQ